MTEEQWLDMCVNDPRKLAFCLSNIGRFGGEYGRATDLSHSLSVHDNLEDSGYSKDVCFWGLMHDAHEPVTGDVTRMYKTPELHIKQGRLDEKLIVRLGLRLSQKDIEEIHGFDSRDGDREIIEYSAQPYRKWSFEQAESMIERFVSLHCRYRLEINEPKET